MMESKNNSQFTVFYLYAMAVVSALLLVVGFAWDQLSAEAEDWVLFLGRFHPVVLHLPIGVFSGFLLLMAVNAFSKDKASTLAKDLLLGMTALTGSLAAAVGFLLASEGGYDAELLFRHKLLGTLFALATVVVAFFRARSLAVGHLTYHGVQVIALLLAAGFMAVAGHLGGSLTHGSTYLTRYAPDWFPGKGAEDSSEKAVLISEDSSETQSVMDIFEARCFSCHGPEKQKGGYRMDDLDVLFAGGDSGLEAIVPGNAMESHLAYLIALPADDDEVMPPEGKEALTDSEIVQIIRWINEGAVLPKGTEEENDVDVAAVEAEVPQPAESVVVKEPEEEASAAQTEEPTFLLAGGKLGSDLDFATQVRPLFDTYCIRCHGPDKQKAQVRMDTLDPDMVNGADADEWAHILDVINSGEMPEADEIQPTVDERRMMVNWLTDELREAKELKKGNTAPIIRRLTKYQYANTLSELLAIDVDFGKNLPPEALSEEGFENNGEVLSMSTLLLEYYMQIAREALSKAIVTEAPPQIHRFKVNLAKGIREKPGRFGLGYKSSSFAYQDYEVEVLPIEGKPFDATAFEFGVNSPYNVKNQKNSLDDVFYVDMRGSSSNRYSILEEGVSMTAALPHVEKDASKWHGPSPNLKIVMRDFPTEGDFVMRVEASRPESIAFPSNFAAYLGEQALIEYSVNSGLKTEDKAIVLDATQPFEDNRLSFKRNYVHFHQSGDGVPRALYRFETTGKNALYQLDVVFAADESRPVDIVIDNNKIEGVLGEVTGGWSDKELKSHSVGLVRLRKGKHSIQFRRDDGPIPHISALVLTPVKASTSLQAVLRTGGTMKSNDDEFPFIRPFMGSRTDDGMEYRVFDEAKPLRAAFGERQILEFRGRLENMPLPVIDHNDAGNLANLAVLGLWNDAFAASYKEQGNPVTIHSIEFEGPYLDSWPSQSHQKIFINSSNKDNKELYAREVIEYFMSRAYRRRPFVEEVKSVWNYWQESYQESGSFERSIQDALLLVLCSPNFLYLVEAPEKGEGLNDFELASRLSYFLWDTMPDNELFFLAANGQLRDQLGAQIERMLQDDRSWAFVENFTKQWLDIASIERTEMSVALYPHYNRFVKEDMVKETLHFVREMLLSDLSIFNFVDSDFAMLNQNLAQFYGIEGVKGSDFQKVSISPDKKRGGLISQGSFLAGHSSGEDSHPIKRGMWLIEKILDDPPPPAPPNVPQIDQENPELIKLSMRKQLEIHRDSDSCRDCHKKIDPWGVAFEEYDAVGLIRTKVRKRDAQGRFYTTDFESITELEDGSVLNGIDDLKRYLLTERKSDVVGSVAKHLLSYALGRSLTFADEEAIQEVVSKTEAGGAKMQTLLESVIMSPLFLNR